MSKTQAERFESNFGALRQYAEREGHAAPPSSHVETVRRQPVPLGTWVGYIRQRYRTGKLGLDRVARFEELPGWEWGPLQPGPTADVERAAEIRRRWASGEPIRKLREEFGVTRQRIHQIVSDDTADVENGACV